MIASNTYKLIFKDTGVHRIQTVSALTSVAGYARPSSSLQTTPECPVLLSKVTRGNGAPGPESVLYGTGNRQTTAHSGWTHWQYARLKVGRGGTRSPGLSLRAAAHRCWCRDLRPW
jgi:hypothetical protein